MIFITSNNINDNVITIKDQDHLHLSKVLRTKIGEKIVACDEKIVYNIKVTEITKSETICEILSKEVVTEEISPKIFVYASLTKGDKMELVTQKVTELGAYSIIPFSSNRSIVKIDEKSKEKKISRLQTIAKEASNQCKSFFVPKILDILSFDEMISHINDKDIAIVLYENEQKSSFKELISKNDFETIAIIIGPEGGFEEQEIEKIVKSGGFVATLGKRILRAETAPIACVSAILYEKNKLS